MLKNSRWTIENILKIKIVSFTLICLFIVLLPALLYYARSTHELKKQTIIVAEIQDLIVQRMGLRDLYFFTDDENTKLQWEQKSKEFETLLSQTKHQFRDEKYLVLLDEIEKYFKQTVQIFNNLIQSNSKVYTQNGKLVFTYEKKLLIEITSASDALYFYCNKLQAEIEKEHQLAAQKMFILILLFSIISIFIFIAKELFRKYASALAKKTNDLISAQNSLLKSEEIYRTLFDSTSDAVVVLDGDKFIDCNRSAISRFGFSSKIEFCNQSVGDISPPTQADGAPSQHAAQSKIAEANKFGSITFEWTHKRHDTGEYFLTEVTLVAMVIQEKNVLFGTIRDISAANSLRLEQEINRIRLESLLSLSQKNFHSEQELLDFALEEALKLTSSIYGYIYHYSEDKQEFTLNTWSKGVLPVCRVQDPKLIYQLDKTGIWGEAVRQKKPIIINDFQADHPLKKGYPEGHAPLSSFMSIPVIKDDAIVAVVGVANKKADYTESDVQQLVLMMNSVWTILEKNLAIKALEESENIYRYTTDMAPDAIMLMNDLGLVTKWNQKAVDIFGYTLEEVHGKDLHDLICPTRYHEVMRNGIAHFFKSGNGAAIGKTLELYGLRKDGTEFPIALSLSGYQFNEKWHAIGIVRDITDQKNLEAQLTQSSKMSALGEMAGGIAHEINSPLCTIKLRAQNIISEIEENTIDLLDVQDSLNVIKTTTDRIGTIVTGLKNFSRYGGQDPMIATEVGAIIKNTLALCQERFKIKGIELKVEILEPVYIKARSVEISQVILNLLGNAIDAVEETEKAWVEISVENKIFANELSQVLIKITDSGVGISDDVAKRIMTPFFTTKEIGKGTGLGLSISKGIIEAHKGRFYLNRECKNTQFIIELPLLKKEDEWALPVKNEAI